jgi:hypothetical protein
LRALLVNVVYVKPQPQLRLNNNFRRGGSWYKLGHLQIHSVSTSHCSETLLVDAASLAHCREVAILCTAIFCLHVSLGSLAKNQLCIMGVLSPLSLKSIHGTDKNIFNTGIGLVRTSEDCTVLRQRSCHCHLL